MRLLLVRHGETEWSAEKRLQGQADIALSDEGKRQARALAPAVQAMKPCAAVTSDLQRAAATASLLGFPDAAPLQALREIGVGDWTGQMVCDLQKIDDDAYGRWRAGTFTPPGGETWSSFAARAGDAVLRASAQKQIETLLAVCHGGVIRALLDRFLGLLPRHIVPVAPASLTVLQMAQDQSFRLELFNYRPVSLEETVAD